jgi:hypothetical protein
MNEEENNVVVGHSNDGRSDFAKFHDELDKRSRQGIRITNGPRPYVKPRTSFEIKGKQMRKWAKKARHLQLNIERDLASK